MLIDADKIRVDFAEILERDYVDGYARGFQAALVAVLRYETIATKPNDPLTLEELRKMDGEPVWVERINIDRPNKWYLLNLRENVAVNNRGGFVSLTHYGDTWLAYRRKPEEGTS